MSPTVFALYRVFYGEDYIKESISRLLPHVDKVIIGWADRPWDSARSVTHKGRTEPIPWVEGQPFDSWKERVESLESEKIHIEPYFQDTPRNQFVNMIRSIILPNYRCPHLIICIEPDIIVGPSIEKFITYGSRYPVSTLQEVELWRNLQWRVPPRDRHNVFLLNMNKVDVDKIESGFSANLKGIETNVFQRVKALNMGFTCSEKTIWYKHLTAMSFSRRIGDTPPDPEWFERWKNWEVGDKNLEIAAGHQHMIPEAILVDDNFECPTDILERWKEIHASVSQ